MEARMTIIEAINRIDTIKPNSYTQAEKVRWLSNLDGIIKRKIIDTHEGGEAIVFEGYTESTPLTTELLVPFPYDDIYLKWLETWINYYNGEYARYNNSVEMYNTAYNEFARYYNRTHMPKSKAFKYSGSSNTNGTQTVAPSTVQISDKDITKIADAVAKKVTVKATNARIGHVTLLASKWEGTSSPYSQVVTIDGVTKNSQVDLTPSIEQLEIYSKKDLTFVAENENGVVTVYAIGDKPLNDYIMQVTITEVSDG